MTMTEFCTETNNWFDRGQDKFYGTFSIVEGHLTYPVELQTNQYFRIVGSVFNDGVYVWPAMGLTDETFDGAIWAMAVPKEVTDLVKSISAYQEKNADAIDKPYNSESFGGYSYSKGNGANGGSSADWQSHFARSINKWRKLK